MNLMMSMMETAYSYNGDVKMKSIIPSCPISIANLSPDHAEFNSITKELMIYEMACTDSNMAQKIYSKKQTKYSLIKQALPSMYVEIKVFVMDMNNYERSQNSFMEKLPDFDHFKELFTLDSIIKNQSNYLSIRRHP